MKLSTQVKLKNCFVNAWFFIKFVIFILVPLLLLIFAAPLFNVIRPFLVTVSRPFVDSLVANRTTITSVIGILVGAFIPIIGTWAYNSNKTKGKNACYKKEVFYKSMLADAEYILQMWSKTVFPSSYRGTLSFWGKNRNTTASKCLNKLLYNGFETLYCVNEQIQTEEKNLSVLVIDFLFCTLGITDIDKTHQFFSHKVYDYLDRNDKEAIKNEIKKLFDRNKINQEDQIDALYEMIVADEQIQQQRMNIKVKINALVKNTKDMVETLDYLISYINKHYEAGTRLA